MSDIYCGTGKTPKGKRIGNMEECVKAGQVRRFGEKKVDHKLVEANEKAKKDRIKAKKTDKEYEDLMIELVIIGGKIRKQKGKIQAEKDKAIKTKLQLELKKMQEKEKSIKAKLPVRRSSRLEAKNKKSSV